MQHYPKMIYKGGQVSSNMVDQRIVADEVAEELASVDGFLRVDPERDARQALERQEAEQRAIQTEAVAHEPTPEPAPARKGKK